MKGFSGVLLAALSMFFYLCFIYLTFESEESYQPVDFTLPSSSVSCTAAFGGTILKGEYVNVSDVKFERGAIMIRYYIPKYQSWFYADSFTNYKCLSLAKQGDSDEKNI